MNKTLELEALVAARTTELRQANEDLQREIAKRLVIEARLRHSEENFRMLFDVAPVMLVLTRLSDQRVILANPQADELFEIPLGKSVGLHAPDFYVNPSDRERLRARLKDEGHVENFDVELKTTSGRPFPVLVSGQLLMFEGEPALLVSGVDVTAQKAVEARLQALATIDPLTGCPNRRHFLELAEREFERAERYDRPVSMAMIDVDHFKDINDRFGHDAGDKSLRAISDTCKRTLRKSDLLGRLGGDEFAILFVETEAAEASAVTDRVRRAVAEIGGKEGADAIAVTISAGVVGRRSKETVESVLKRADQALYGAKDHGRNWVVLA